MEGWRERIDNGNNGDDGNDGKPGRIVRNEVDGNKLYTRTLSSSCRISSSSMGGRFFKEFSH